METPPAKVINRYIKITVYFGMTSFLRVLALIAFYTARIIPRWRLEKHVSIL